MATRPSLSRANNKDWWPRTTWSGAGSWQKEKSPPYSVSSLSRLLSRLLSRSRSLSCAIKASSLIVLFSHLLVSADIKAAPPRDPKTRYRFFGYLVAYLASIYGHRAGVLTRMRVKEVKEAVGDDNRGYLISVSILLLTLGPFLH